MDRLERLGWQKDEFGFFNRYEKGIMTLYVYEDYVKVKCDKEYSEENKLSVEDILALSKIVGGF